MISISETGTYSLYDSSDALSVGTYYIKLENDYYATYDDIILFKCRDFLNNEIKKNIRSRYYDNDISDEERNNWLNDL